MKGLQKILLVTASAVFLTVQANAIMYFARPYDPNLQCWLTRDPIHEVGFLTLKAKKLGWHENAELNLYAFVGNAPIYRFDPLGLIDWGPLGGKCCNNSSSPEWVLVGDGVWRSLPAGKCTGFWDDCDGYTCSGGFYTVHNMSTGTCNPSTLCSIGNLNNKWTPNGGGPHSTSPGGRGAQGGNGPPGYPYGDWP